MPTKEETLYNSNHSMLFWIICSNALQKLRLYLCVISLASRVLTDLNCYNFTVMLHILTSEYLAKGTFSTCFVNDISIPYLFTHVHDVRAIALHYV